MRKLLILFLVWRCLLFLIPIAVSQVLPFRPAFEFTHLSYYTPSEFLKSHPELNAWANFDGIEYLAIAGRGYIDEARFFPLLPMIIHFIDAPLPLRVFDVSQYVTGLVITNVFFFLSLVMMKKIVLLDFDEKVAEKTVLAVLFFPTSFFFVSVYTESLFLLLALLAFYFARKGKWPLAAVCGVFLSTTRLVGVFIFPALLYECALQHRFTFSHMTKFFQSSDFFKTLRSGWSLFFIPVGLLLFSIFNYLKWGNEIMFLRAQGDLHNGRSVSMLVNPAQTLFRYVKIFHSLVPAQYEWWVAVFEIGSFFVALWLFYLSWKKNVRPSYLLFAVLSFLLPVFSGTFTGLPRYILILFPFFIALALIQQKYVFRSLLLAGGGLLILFLSLFSRGFFVA